MYLLRIITILAVMTFGACNLFSGQNKNNANFFEIVKKGQVEKLKTLIDRGFDLNVKDDSGKTALHYADYNIAQVLLRNNANANIKDENGLLPLDMVFSKLKEAHDTSLGEHLKKQYLLYVSNGAKFGLGFENYSKLDAASEKAFIAIINDALANKVDLNSIIDQCQRIPICQAVLDNYPNGLNFLIKNNINVNTIDPLSKFSSLHYAVLSKNKDITFLLLLFGGDVNLKCKNEEMTPFEWALTVGNYDMEMLELLYNHGAVTEHNGLGEKYSFLPQLMQSNAGVVRIYLKACGDANLDATDSFGESVMYQAVRHNKIDIVDLLLSKGADVTIKNKFGETALDYAYLKENRAIIELFYKYHPELKTKIEK